MAGFSQLLVEDQTSASVEDSEVRDGKVQKVSLDAFLRCSLVIWIVMFAIVFLLKLTRRVCMEFNHATKNKVCSSRDLLVYGNT